MASQPGASGAPCSRFLPKSVRSRPRARAERMFASASRAGSEVSRRVREAIGRCFVPLPPGDFASSRPEGKIAREAGTDVVVSQRTARRCPSALRCDPQLHRKPKTTSVTRPMTPTTLAFLHQATWGPVFFAGAASLAETTPSAAEGSSANRQGPSSPERDLQPLSPLGAEPTWGDLQVQPRGAILPLVCSVAPLGHRAELAEYAHCVHLPMVLPHRDASPARAFAASTGGVCRAISYSRLAKNRAWPFLSL